MRNVSIIILTTFLAYGLRSQTIELNTSTTDNGGGSAISTNYQALSTIGGVGGNTSSTNFSINAGFYASQSFLVGNSPPTSIGLSNRFLVDGSLSGSVVGSFITEDLNSEDIFTYTFASGVGDTDNGKFIIDDNTLTTSMDLPTGTYSIRVQSSDGSDAVSTVFSIETVIIPTSSVLSVGRLTTDHRIFGVPTDDIRIGEVFTELDDNLLGESWRISDISSVNLTTDSTVHAGKGYWYVNKVNTTVDLRSVPPVSLNENLEFELSLDSGWNLIGNPFLSQLNWANVIQFNETQGTISPGDLSPNGICTYNGAYNTSSGINIFEGGWTLSSKSVTIRIPSPGAAIVRGRTETSKKPVDASWLLNQGEWQLLLEISDGDRQSNLPAIGMHQRAKIRRDAFDLSAPPTTFLKNGFTLIDSMGLVRNFVPPAKEASWTFEIDAPGHEYISVSWDRQIVNDLNESLYMHVTSTNRSYNMKAFSTVQVPANSSILVTYGGATKWNTVDFYSKAYPNPLNTNVNVEFFLEGENPNSEVSILLFSMNGQNILHKKAIVPQGELQAIKLDLSGLPAGTYFYQISSGSVKSSPKKLIVR